MFVVASAAGVAGLLGYTPPRTELRMAGLTPVRSRPVVAEAFTATPASVPGWPAPPAAASTSTTTPPAPAPAPEPVASSPAPEPDSESESEAEAAPAPVVRSTPTPAPADVAVGQPEADGEADGPVVNCAGLERLLTALDDQELRTAIATVGCS